MADSLVLTRQTATGIKEITDGASAGCFSGDRDAGRGAASIVTAGREGRRTASGSGAGCYSGGREAGHGAAGCGAAGRWKSLNCWW